MTARPELFLRSDFPRPMGVLNAESLRLDPIVGDAALVRQLRTELTVSENIIDDLQRDIAAAEQPPMKVVREYRCRDQRLSEVVMVAETLETLGYTVGLKWARDERNLIDGLVIAVVEED